MANDDLKAVVMGLLFVAFITIGIGNWGASMQNIYNRTDVKDIKTFDASQRTLDLTNQMKASIENTQITGISFIDTPLTWSINLWNSVKLIFGSINIWTSLFTDLAEALAVGDSLNWVVGIGIGVITLLIIFGMISRGG